MKPYFIALGKSGVLWLAALDLVMDMIQSGQLDANKAPLIEIMHI